MLVKTLDQTYFPLVYLKGNMSGEFLFIKAVFPEFPFKIVILFSFASLIIFVTFFFEFLFYRRGHYRRVWRRDYRSRSSFRWMFDLRWGSSHSSCYSLSQLVWVVQQVFFSFLVSFYHIPANLVCSWFCPLQLKRQSKQLLLSSTVE